MIHGNKNFYCFDNLIHVSAAIEYNFDRTNLYNNKTVPYLSLHRISKSKGLIYFFQYDMLGKEIGAIISEKLILSEISLMFCKFWQACKKLILLPDAILCLHFTVV